MKLTATTTSISIVAGQAVVGIAFTVGSDVWYLYVAFDPTQTSDATRATIRQAIADCINASGAVPWTVAPDDVTIL